MVLRGAAAVLFPGLQIGRAGNFLVDVIYEFPLRGQARVVGTIGKCGTFRDCDLNAATYSLINTEPRVYFSVRRHLGPPCSLLGSIPRTNTDRQGRN
jgi:hypothetical protein